VSIEASAETSVEPTGDAVPAPATEVDSVVDLRDRLVELQATVERLVAASGSPESTGDPEVDRASRTLRFAQQTADSVVGEAHDEARAIVADAERQRSEIIRRARRQADEDYSAERQQVEAASGAWFAQRAELLDQLDSLTSVFAQYREGLDHLDTAVRGIADRLRSESAALQGVGGVADPHTVHLTVVGNEPEADAEGSGSESAPGSVRRNPFTPSTSTSPVSHVAPVDADADPFVFDVDDLPETTGDFGWETDDPADGANTF